MRIDVAVEVTFYYQCAGKYEACKRLAVRLPKPDQMVLYGH